MDLIALFAPMARSTTEPWQPPDASYRTLPRQRGSDFIAPTMLADSGHVACPTCMKHGSACAFINQEVRRLARCSCQRSELGVRD